HAPLGDGDGGRQEVIEHRPGAVEALVVGLVLRGRLGGDGRPLGGRGGLGRRRRRGLGGGLGPRRGALRLGRLAALGRRGLRGLAGVGFAALGRGALAGGLARLLALGFGWGLAALLPGLQRDQRLLGGVLLGRALGAALAGADDLALQHHVRDEARLVLGTRLGGAE